MNSFSEVLQKKEEGQCPRSLTLALRDAMNAVEGKWKLPIIAALFHGKDRFTDLLSGLEKITPRMLSRELKALELNGIVCRRETPQPPVQVVYGLTGSGERMVRVIDAMIGWGLEHRQATMISG